MIYNLEQDITCGGVRLYKERIISVLRTALPVHVEMFNFVCVLTGGVSS